MAKSARKTAKAARPKARQSAPSGPAGRSEGGPARGAAADGGGRRLARSLLRRHRQGRGAQPRRRLRGLSLQGGDPDRHRPGHRCPAVRQPGRRPARRLGQGPAVRPADAPVRCAERASRGLCRPGLGAAAHAGRRPGACCSSSAARWPTCWRRRACPPPACAGPCGSRGWARIYACALRVWLKDESADLSKTMAELDKRLGQVERCINMTRRKTA